MLRIVAVSDTHGRHEDVNISHGDVLIHCGDFSNHGTEKDFFLFLNWLQSQPHEHKLFTPGNHDEWVEQNLSLAKSIVEDTPGVTMLINEEHCIDGVKFFGSPFVPTFGDWSFMLDRDIIGRKWEQIPEDVTVLFTHGPAYGHGDLAPPWGCSSLRGKVAGDIDLLLRIKEVKPQLHLFGHIHGGYGRTKSDAVPETLFINCAVCTEKYSPDNTAQVVNMHNL
mgnify:CR=1 FL=1|tara:strand:- start:88899 stop:89567 length:669 start_codon:yes stop_codon:yes gene_type:complete